FSAMNTTDGNVWAWGDNVYGILGQNNRGGTLNVNTASPYPLNQIGDPGSDYPNGVAYSPTSVANPQKVKAIDPDTGAVIYLSNVKAIAAGYEHMVALDADGYVWTWGRNDSGQLGYATTATYNNVTYSPIAQRVSIRENGKDVEIMDIAAGRYHTVVATTTGEVWAWGNDAYGQLGRETLSEKWVNSYVPVKVLGDRGEGHLGNVVMVDAGGDTSAALKGDGTVWTWGRNDKGQLGINENQKPIGAPTQVRKGDSANDGNYLTGIGSIAVGENHMLAIQSTVIFDTTLTADQLEAAQQKVFGWGDNTYKQLTSGKAEVAADGTITGYTYDTQSADYFFVPRTQYAAPEVDQSGKYVDQKHLYGVKTVEAGVYSSAAINRIDHENFVPIDPTADPTDPATELKYRRDAELYAWGYGNLGQLGDGNSANHNVNFPLFVQDGETAEHVATKDILDTSVDTQGYKVTEKTGNLTNVKDISMGYNHASTIRYDGYIWGWGNNRYLQLGTINLQRLQNNTPVISGYRYDGGIYVTASIDQEDGDLTASTEGVDSATDQLINGVTTTTGLNLGSGKQRVTVSEADVADHNAWRYRMDDSQQLRLKADHYITYSGTNATTQRVMAQTGMPGAPGMLTNYITVEVTDTSIAVANKVDGQWVIRAAGLNEYGETSVVFKAYEALRDKRGDPIYENGTSKPVSADEGYQYQVVATSIMQLEVYPATGMATPMVVSGVNHTLALKADGTVWAWGSNMYGQLGIATSVNRNNRNAVEYCPRFGRYAYTKYWTTAYDSQGRSTFRTYTTPQKVLGWQEYNSSYGYNSGSGADASSSLSGIIAIAAGEYTSYALAADGSVYSWGYNNAAELGNGNWNYTYEYLYQFCHHHCYWCSHCGCYTDWWAAIRDTNAYSPVKVTAVGTTISYYGAEVNEAGNHFISSRPAYMSDAVQITAGRDFAMALRSDGTVVYWGNSGAYQSVEYLYTDFSVPQYDRSNRDGWRTEDMTNGGGSTRDAMRGFGALMRAGDAVPGEWHVTTINGAGSYNARSSHHSTDAQYGYQGVSGSYGATTYSSASNYISKLVPVTVLGLHGTDYLADNNLNADETTSDKSLKAPTTAMTAANYGARITKIAAGDEFSVALTSAGTVFTWGINTSGSGGSWAYNYAANNHGASRSGSSSWDSIGALGDGSDLDRIYPVQVKAGEQAASVNYLTDIVDIAVGDGHVLALDSFGQVWAWGDNTYGQLGNGTTTGSNVPVKVLATGDHVIYQTDTDGNIVTDESGQPVVTKYALPITRIFAGANASAAIDAEGHLYTWGDNAKGQLGLAKTDAAGNELAGKTKVTYLERAVAGESRDSGTAGLLSVNNTDEQAFLGAQSVALSHSQTTIYKNDVRLTETAEVQVGTYTPGTDLSVYAVAADTHSVRVEGDKILATVTVRTQQAQNGGTVYAMGTIGDGTHLSGRSNGAYGPQFGYMSSSNALGDSKSVSSPNTPVLVGARDEDTIRIDQIGYITDFMHYGDVVYQDFDGALTEHTRYNSVATTGEFNTARFQLTEGDALRIGINYTKTVQVADPKPEGADEDWVQTYHDETESGENLLRYTVVGTNLYRTAGVGEDHFGQAVAEDFLSSFSTTDSIGFAGIDRGVHTGIKSPITTDQFTVVSSDESILTVYVNPASGYFELRTMPNAFGTVAVMIRENTTQVTRMFSVTVRPKEDRTESPNVKLTAPKVVYGENFAMALMADGSVWTWGDNTYGQLGDGTSGAVRYEYSPIQVRGENGNDYLKGIVDIAAGANHALAIAADGTVWAWGNNDHGQLGIGTNGNIQVYPAQTSLSNVNAYGTIVQISGGYDHTLAVTDRGYAFGWGSNANRQVNRRANSDGDVLMPVRLERGGLVNTAEHNWGHVYDEGYLVNVESVYAGRNYSLVRTVGGYVYSFGVMNGSNDIGDVNVGNTHSIVPSVTLTSNGSRIAPFSEDRQRVPMPVREGSEINHQGNYLRDALLVAANFTSTADHILLLGMSGNEERTVKAAADIYGTYTTIESSVTGDDPNRVYAVSDDTAGTTFLRSDRSGTVYAIGPNAARQLSPDRGNMVAGRPVVVNGLTTGYTYLGTVTDSEGTTTQTTLTAQAKVDVNDRIVALAVGGTGSAILTKAGDVHQWGSNLTEIVTLDHNAVNSIPVSVSKYDETGLDHNDFAMDKYRQTYGLAMSNGAVVVLKSDGTLWSWGSNKLGQLGMGMADTAYATTIAEPRQVYYAQIRTQRLALQQVDVGTADYTAAGDIVTIDYSTHMPWEIRLNKHQLQTFRIDPEDISVQRTDTFNILTQVVWYPGMYTADEDRKRLVFKSLNERVLTFSATVPGLAVINWANVETGMYSYVTVTDPDTGYTAQIRVAFFDDAITYVDGVAIGVEGHVGDGQLVHQSATPAILLGEEYSFALKADGTVWAWGRNQSYNNLSSGNVAADSPVFVPAQVRDPEDESGYLTGVTQIAGGDHFVLFLKGSGQVYAWGLGDHGQLGYGDTVTRSIAANSLMAVRLDAVQYSYPNTLNGNPDVRLGVEEKFDGAYATYAQGGPAGTFGGTPYGDYGMNSAGQFFGSYDNSQVVTASATDKALFGYTGHNVTDGFITTDHYYTHTYANRAIKVAAGTQHAAALMQDGTVYIWGYDNAGEIGRDKIPYTNFSTAFRMKTANVTDLAGGRDHTLMLKGDGTVWAFGNNAYGQLGNSGAADKGQTAAHAAEYRYNDAVQVLKADGTALTGIVAIQAGNYFSLALDDTGHVWYWGQVGGQNNLFATRLDLYRSENGEFLGEDLVYQMDAIHNSAALLTSGLSRMDGGINATDEANQGQVYHWKYVGATLPGQENLVQAGEAYVTTTLDDTADYLLSDVTAVGVADSHIVLMTENGAMYAYGSDAFAALGDKDGFVDNNGDSSLSDRDKDTLHRITGDRYGLLPTLYEDVTDPDNPVEKSVSSQGEDPVILIYNNQAIRLTQVVTNDPYYFNLTRYQSRKLEDANSGRYRVEIQSGADNIVSIDEATGIITADPTATGIVKVLVRDLEHMDANGQYLELGVITLVVNRSSGSGEESNTIVPMVAAGDDFNIALTADGKIYTWGTMDNGVLGRDVLTGAPANVAGEVKLIVPAVMAEDDPETEDVDESTEVITPARELKAIAVAAGQYHAVAIDEEGNLWTWGHNVYSQLGRATEGNYDGNPVRLTIPATSDEGRTAQVYPFVDVVAGDHFTLALDDHGQVWSWGRNEKGQTGTGTPGANVTVPKQVMGFSTSSQQLENLHTPYKLDGVVKIAAGDRHAVALTAGGAVYTWGDNDHGQLGQGQMRTAYDLMVADPTYDYQPREILDENLYPFSYSHTVVDIAAGNTFTLVLTDDIYQGMDMGLYGQLGEDYDRGNVYAFGYNYNGSLGNGDQIDRYYPTKVLTTQNTAAAAEPIRHITGIAAGGYSAFAFTAEDQVYTWGQNTYGQLGDGSAATKFYATINYYPHNSSLIYDQERNEFGVGLYASQYTNGLGVYTIDSDTVPTTTVPNGRPVVKIENAQLTYVKNIYGQQLYYDPSIELVKSTVVTAWPIMVGADDFTFDGANAGISVNVDDGYLTDIRQIDVGNEHMVMIRDDGFVLTSGRNDHGQIGMGDSAVTKVTIPSIVEKQAAANATTTPRSISYVATRYNSDLTEPTVQDMAALSHVVNIRNDQFLTLTDLALLLDNTGAGLLNVFGNTMLSTDNTNFKIATSAPLVDIVQGKDAAGKTAFTIRPVYAEYQGADGVVRNGVEGTTLITITETVSGLSVQFTLNIAKTNEVNAPLELKTMTEPMIVSGEDFTLALKADGTLWAWGSNAYGQLGVDSLPEVTYLSVPTQVVKDDSYRNTNGLTNVVSVAAAGQHAVAIDADGNIWTWGRNGYTNDADDKYGNPLGRDADYVPTTNTFGSVVTGDSYRGKPVQIQMNIYSFMNANHGYPVKALAGDQIISYLTSGNAVYSLEWYYRDGTNRTPKVWRPYLRATGVAEADYMGNTLVYAGTNGVAYVNGTEVKADGATLSGIKSVAAGSAHTLFLTNAGTVYAYGSNNHGQLGNGTTTNSTTAVQVLRPDRSVLGENDPVVHIATGGNVSMAVTQSGILYTWGQGDVGQQGDGERYDQVYATELSAHADFYTGIGYDLDHDGVTTDLAAAQSNRAAMDTTGTSTIAMDAKGAIYSWGSNVAGALGIGHTSQRVDQVLLPQAMGADKTLEVGYAAILNLNDTYADADSDTVTAFLDYYGFDRLVQYIATGVDTSIQTLQAEPAAQLMAASEPMAVTLFAAGSESGSDASVVNINDRSDISFVSSTVRVPEMNRVVADGILFNAANPLGDKVVLGEGQVFIVKKSEVYEVNNFYFNLIHGYSTDSNRVEDLSMVSSNMGQFESRENWIVLPHADKDQRFESGTITLSDRYLADNDADNGLANYTDYTTYNYGRATRDITIEYRHQDDPYVAATLGTYEKPEDSSVDVTPMVVSYNDFTVALMSDGTVWTWGANIFSVSGTGVAQVGRARVETPMQVRAYVNADVDQYGDYLKDIVKLAAGGNHILALDKYGYVYAWGANDKAQLGGGASTTSQSTYSTVPVRVLKGQQDVESNFLSNIVDIAAGNQFSVAVDADGFVYTWGANYYGVLGINRTGPRTTDGYYGYASEQLLSNQATPVRVLRGTTTGGKFYYNSILDPVLAANDRIDFAWDQNDLADMGKVYLTNIVAVAAGDDHILALDQYGNVYAWGDDRAGQLGVARDLVDQDYDPGSSVILNETFKSVPMRTSISDAASIYAGFNTSAVIRKDGTLWTFGDQSFGGMNSVTTSVPTQMELPNDTLVTQAAIGYAHMMALGRDGAVYTWGSDRYGQLGHGNDEGGIREADYANILTDIYYEQVPVTEPDPEFPDVMIETGDTVNVRRGTTITLNGTQGYRALAVTAGENHSVVLMEDGSVYAMGYNNNMQLGTTDSQLYAMESKGLRVGVDQKILGLYLNELTWTATKTVGEEDVALTWSEVVDANANADPADDVALNSANVNYEYVRFVGGQVILDLDRLGTKTWDGFNLINANVIRKLDAADVKLRSLNEEVAVVKTQLVNGRHVGVVDVVGFGVGYIIAEYTDPATGYKYSNAFRVYGKPLPEDEKDLESIPSLTYPQVGAGENFSVVLRDNGTVWTFGSNYDEISGVGDGRLGKGRADVVNYTSPQQIIGAGMVGSLDTTLVNMVITKIAVGNNFTVALTDKTDPKEQLVVWGNNQYGQLGRGLNAEGKLENVLQPTYVDVTPYLVRPGDYIVDIAAGENYTLFLTKMGDVYGMGSNADGKLVMGESGMKSTQAVPTRIVLPSNAQAVDISTNISTSHVLTWTGDVVSWGEASKGQFGTSNYSLQGPNYAEIGTYARMAADGSVEEVLPVDRSGDPITSASRFIAIGSGAGAVAAIDVDGAVAVWGDNAVGQLAAYQTKKVYEPAKYQIKETIVEPEEGTEPAEPTIIREKIKVADGQFVVSRTIPDSVMEASYQTSYNTTYSDVYTVGADTKLIGTYNSVALQTAMGQTGYVLYTKLGNTKITSDGAVDSSALIPYTLQSAGYNDHGQLGISRGGGSVSKAQVAQTVQAGEANPINSAARVDNLMFIATSPYGGSVLAYDNNYGSVYGWGNNTSGQLGDGTYGDHTTPVMVLMDGGGSYLDISHVLVNDDPTLPDYTATILFNVAEEAAASSTAQLAVAGVVTTDFTGATSTVKATAGTAIDVNINMAKEYTIGSVAMVTSGGVVIPMPFTKGDGEGPDTTGVKDHIDRFIMPAEDVTIMVTVIDYQFASGGVEYTLRLGQDLLNEAPNSYLGLSTNPKTSAKAMVGERVPFAIEIPNGKALTRLHYREYTGQTPADDIIGMEFTVIDSITPNVALGEFIMNLTDDNVNTHFVIEAEFGPAGSNPAYALELDVVDNYNPVPGTSLTAANSVTVTSTSDPVGISGITVDNDVLNGKATIKAGDLVTVSANLGTSSYYIKVTAETQNFGAYEIPVRMVDSQTATFVMPSDDVDLTVRFLYGGITTVQYDTLISAKGEITTAVNYGDKVRIAVKDIVANLGFNAYGPFKYTPKPENLNFFSTNERVAKVDNNCFLPAAQGGGYNPDFGLITAGDETAGYTYIIVTDDRGNTGYFKLGVVPGPQNVDGVTLEKDVAFPMIEVGANHTIALKSDGSVWAWGKNNLGQLGLQRDTSQSTTPAEVLTAVTVDGQTVYVPLTGVVKIAAGGNHNLALKSDGTVWAWGDNALGALGQGSIGGVQYTAVQVRGVNYANDQGMLGNDLYSSAIVDIVAAGEVDEKGNTIRQYSMALDKSGRVFAWGYNYHGVVNPGNNTGDAGTTLPLPVNISQNFTILNDPLTLSADKIAANARILKRDGQVISWGLNDAQHRTYGGYGTTETPERAVLGGRALEVSGGVYNAVAVTTGGLVKTWGGDTSVDGYDTRYANGKHDVYILPGEQMVDSEGNLLTTTKYLPYVDVYGNEIYVKYDEEGNILSRAYMNVGTGKYYDATSEKGDILGTVDQITTPEMGYQVWYSSVESVVPVTNETGETIIVPDVLENYTLPTTFDALSQGYEYGREVVGFIYSGTTQLPDTVTTPSAVPSGLPGVVTIDQIKAGSAPSGSSEIYHRSKLLTGYVELYSKDRQMLGYVPDMYFDFSGSSIVLAENPDTPGKAYDSEVIVEAMLSLNQLTAGYKTPEGYTKLTQPIYLGMPVTADISTYLQVAYNDGRLWSVG
ncbi:MAG: hypothetical protein NC311_09985, partial [Muribaculaceae bacterium]|nr:hypothetical protein [Muribaculaceae bacterium]